MKQVTLVKDVVTEVIHVDDAAGAVNYQAASSYEDWPVSPEVAIPPEICMSFETVKIRTLAERRRPETREEFIMVGPGNFLERRWHFAIREQADRALPFSIEGMFRRNEELETENLQLRTDRDIYRRWWKREQKLNFALADMGRWHRFKFFVTGRLPKELRPIIRVMAS